MIPHDLRDVNNVITNPDEDSMMEEIAFDSPQKLIERQSVSLSSSSKDKSNNYTTIKLDTCGGVSIFKDKHLLDNIRESYKQIIISGIKKLGSEIMCNEIGTSHIFGPIYYSENCSDNILCYADMNKVARSIEYDRNDKQFKIKMEFDKPTYLFRETDDIHYEHRVNCPEDSIPVTSKADINAVTVKDKMRKYAQDEVAKAEQALEIMHRPAHPGLKRSVEIINNGMYDQQFTYHIKGLNSRL